ncbi:MAG: polysaccharide deacetylase family protein [Natronospirillum sp.]
MIVFYRVFLGTLFTLILSSPALALNILMYHHIADDTPPSTSTRVSVFQDHLDYLKDNHTVVDLLWAMDEIRAGRSLPDNAVAITFDDAYRNNYTTAWPMLKDAGFPFTIFTSTFPVDQGSRIAMTWDMHREMHAAGVTILNHSHGHEYLVRSDNYDAAWLQEAMDSIRTAQARLEAELGTELRKVFAYPYGEYNDLLQSALRDEGYEMAFGQHSGGVGEFSDMMALPRFAAGGIYANLNTLRPKLRSRPLPVEFPLIDPVTSDRFPILRTRTLENADVRWDALQCFSGGGDPLPTKIESGWLITQTESELRDGRQRYNCTAPSRSTNGVFYWLSQQWLINQGPADR